MGSWKGEPQLVPADRIRLAVLHQGLVRPSHRGAVYRGGPVLRGWGGRRERLIRLPDYGAADAGAPPSARLQRSKGLERPGVGGCTRRSPAATSLSWRRAALASAITSHASGLPLRSLTQRASATGQAPSFFTHGATA